MCGVNSSWLYLGDRKSTRKFWKTTFKKTTA